MENATSRVVVEWALDVATVTLVCCHDWNVGFEESAVVVVERIHKSLVGCLVGKPTDAVDAFPGCFIVVAVVVAVAGVVPFGEHFFHVGSDALGDVVGGVGGLIVLRGCYGL